MSGSLSATPYMSMALVPKTQALIHSHLSIKTRADIYKLTLYSNVVI